MIAEWMDRLIEVEVAWCWLVQLATWRALPILVIVASVGLALRRKLSPALHSLLLTLVLVRLLLPISIGSPTSLHKPIEQWFTSDAADSSLRTSLSYYQAAKFLPNIDRADAQAELVQVETPSAVHWLTWEETVWAVVLLIVVLVTIGLILRSIYSHVRFALGLRACRLLEDQPLIDLVLRECDSLAVGRRPALREVQSLSAPAVFGLFRQTICLPPGLTETLSEQELRWVIRHELAHIRRRDIPVAMMASIASAFHWFNPIVWLIVRRLCAAMEAAADRTALQNHSQNEVAAYGELLLRFAQDSLAAKKSPTLGLISFASGKHLKQRVEWLMRDSKPYGMTTQCLSAVLVAAIVLSGLTDATEVVVQQMPEVHLASSDSTESIVQSLLSGLSNPTGVEEFEWNGASFVKTYDVTDIFETMPKSLKEDKKTPLEQLTAWVAFPPGMKNKLHLDGKNLSANLTANQHRFLQHTLESWQEGEPIQISIEARIIQTNLKTASSIDWTSQKIEGLTVRGLGPAIAARIEGNELAQFVQSVSEDQRSNVLFAPKVTLFDGQTATMADQVRRPFVTGFNPMADGSMQPVVSIVHEGLSFLLTPKAGDDGRVTLFFEVTASNIGKVSYANLPLISSITTEPQYTVQVPATEQYAVSSTVELRADESVVVAIPRVFDNKPGADAETTVIVALTPRIINSQESSVDTGQIIP